MKEKKLAVPRTMRSGNWRPAFVTEETERTERTDEMETERTKNNDKAVLIQVEDNPDPKRKRTPRTLMKKYLDVIKESTDPETVFDEVIKQPVTIKLQDLLACSSTFVKLLFKEVSILKEEISMSSVRVSSIGLCQQNQEKTYTV
jgi:hypothetical protein